MLACLVVLMGLAPGRYLGESPAGDVWLWLKADGVAEFGGAPVRWRMDADTLVLEGQQTWRLTVLERNGRTCLKGAPFKRICLTPAPLAAPPPPPKRHRPTQWIGAWRHVATGGSLTLALDADGRYRMQQAATGDGIEETHGGWHAEADCTSASNDMPCPPNRLILIPDGGDGLTYRARLAGQTFLIGGGDLPMEIGFKQIAAPK